MNLLRALLMALIVYIPNQAQFKLEFTIKGLNVLNVLFLLVLAVMLTLGVRARTPAPLKGALWLLVGLLVWAFVVGVLRDPSEWVSDLTVLKNILLTLLLYPLVYHAAQDARTVRLLFLTIVGVTLFTALLGVRQALDYDITVYNETRRVAAPFGWSYYNANRSAIYFAIFMPLLGVVALLSTERAWLRALAAAGFGLAVFAVFFTYSRQAYLIVALITLLLVLRRSWIVAILLLVTLSSYEAWAPETVVARIQSTEKAEDEWAANPPPQPSAMGGDSLAEGRFDESTESRLIIWEGAGQMILENPWGIGLNHFKREIGNYVPRYRNMDAHNNYVLFTAEAGIVGPIGLLVLLGSLALLARRVARIPEDPFARCLGYGFGLSVLSVALGNIYGSRFFDTDVMGNFWILAALAARYWTLQSETAATPAAAVAPTRATGTGTHRPA